MRDWIVVFCVGLLSFVLGAFLIPSILLARDERRERLANAARPPATAVNHEGTQVN